MICLILTLQMIPICRMMALTPVFQLLNPRSLAEFFTHLFALSLYPVHWKIALSLPSEYIQNLLTYHHPNAIFLV